MGIFSSIYNVIAAITNWIWGLPVLILLVGGGIIISAIIGCIQLRRFGFIMKNTIGSLANKEEQAKKKAAGVSPFQAVTAALGGTVGTGNIVGAGAAIATGGPGALFWMWVCGFIAMAIKFAEVTLSCAYRKKDEDGSYKAGPFMYIKDGLHCLPWAVVFGVMMLITLCVICGVHSSAIITNLASVGVSKYLALVMILVVLVIVIVFGMRGLVSISDKLVPIMSGLYILVALGVIILNVGNIGTVLSEIFKGAFTGQSAVGGFTGVSVASTIRFGLARGVFSNDAGLGLSASVQAQAEAIDHPAQQGMWAVFEVFLDTIIICSLTGFMILFTGVWQSGDTGATLAATALGSTYGIIGQIGCIICLVLFGLSSLLTAFQAVMIQAVSMFSSKVIGHVFQAFIIAMIVLGCLTDINSVYLLADFGNGVVLFLNIPAIVLLGKTLRKKTKEWFDNDGDLEVIRKLNNE